MEIPGKFLMMWNWQNNWDWNRSCDWHCGDWQGHHYHVNSCWECENIRNSKYAKHLNKRARLVTLSRTWTSEWLKTLFHFKNICFQLLSNDRFCHVYLVSASHGATYNNFSANLTDNLSRTANIPRTANHTQLWLSTLGHFIIKFCQRMLGIY